MENTVETLVKATEDVAIKKLKPTDEVTAEKPYTFRLLGAPDIFLMAKIISQIGIKEFKACFESDGINELIQNMTAGNKEEGATDNSNIVSVGVGVAVELAGVILGNLPKCENDIYQMLAQTSNLSVEEIKAPGNTAMFLEMVIDFIKKEEFRDFIKVVSKLFK